MVDKITIKEYRKLSRKKLKYGNKITKYKGKTFHSKGECERYKELMLLEKVGVIRDLRRQVKHKLLVDVGTEVVEVGTYTSDFEYYERGNHYIIEDFKGVRTALFNLKWNILKTMYSGGIKDGSVVLRLTSKGRS